MRRFEVISGQMSGQWVYRNVHEHRLALVGGDVDFLSEVVVEFQRGRRGDGSEQPDASNSALSACGFFVLGARFAAHRDERDHARGDREGGERHQRAGGRFPACAYREVITVPCAPVPPAGPGEADPRRQD